MHTIRYQIPNKTIQRMKHEKNDITTNYYTAT